MKTRVITVVSILALVSASFAFMMPGKSKVEAKSVATEKPLIEPTAGGGGIDPK